ncbi:MAG: V-type ATP synthase subunit I [Clostridium sp.]|nr:V-type ATP synthase subunit I [Clostridium sp.]
MAIVKMNKFTLLTFESKKEKLLHRLQGFSNVEFINLQDENIIENNEAFQSLSKDEVDSNIAKYEEDLSKAKMTLDFLTSYMPKKSGLKALEDDKENLTIDELEEAVKNINWDEIYVKVKEKEDELHSIESKITKLEGEIEVLTPWQALDISFEALNELETVSSFVGSISKQYEEQLTEALGTEYVEIISRGNNDTNILVVSLNERRDEVLNILRGFGFSSFKSELNEVPKVAITNYAHEIEELKSKTFFVKEEVASFEEDYKKMKLVYDYLMNAVLRYKASNNFLRTTNTVTIQGWCEVEKNDELQKICKEVLNDEYYISFEEVKEEEVEVVPVKLKNGLLSKTFESVTEMYSLPKYNELDPTPLLVPFYLIFFGMMVADVGYGLTMFAVAFCAMKFLKLDKKNQDFARFFLYLSIPTTIIGLIYGSFFGDAVKIPGLISPTEDVNTLLVASLVFGVVQIFFGLGIKAYALIKSGKPKDALYDSGSWLITLISIGLLAGSMMLGWSPIIKYISIAGMAVGMIIIVLTGGRAEKTKGAQIGQGLYALYGITGYIGDLVSYTRLMALGLAGGCIASALNLLMQSLTGFWVILIPVVFILAHVFNLLLSLLGAYVHTARLQYVEYFSKFYEGGGKAFTPFKASEKYMNLKEN